MGARQIAWLAQANETFTHFPHTNNLGTTTQVTDQSGNLTHDLLWYPFGDQWTNSGSGATRSSGGCCRATIARRTVTPNRRFVPELGRWLAPDPLAGDLTNPQSLNRYAYVMNNPTRLTDPSGLCPTCPPPCANLLYGQGGGVPEPGQFRDCRGAVIRPNELGPVRSARRPGCGERLDAALPRRSMSSPPRHKGMLSFSPSGGWRRRCFSGLSASRRVT
jgi:RHS repeat-associated protein